MEATLRAQGIARPLPVVAYSNGAILAVALAFLRPDLVATMALLRGAYPLPCLGRGAALTGMRIFASAGQTDELLPPRVFATGVRSLASLGAIVEFRVYPNIGHGLGLCDARDLRSWLADVRGRQARAAQRGRAS